MTSDPDKQKHAYHPLRVAKIVRETADSCSVVFDIPPNLQDVFAYRAGQFLTLEIPHGELRLRRCYSLASSPDWDREHKVTIKRVEGGRISNWINDQLAEGDVVQVLPPDGRFVITHDADRMLLFAGGSGITPCISLIKSALKKTGRTVRLVYANRSSESVIFDEELRQLAEVNPERFELVSRLDNVDGYLRVRDIAPLCRGYEGAEVFLCGPQAFMDTVEAGLKAAGMDLERLHTERFVSPADPRPDGEPQTGAPEGAELPETVQMTVQGETFDVPYVPGKTLLQSALDADVDAPYSCEEGFCGCCTAKLLEGEVHMTEDEALTPDEKQRGYILACQARPVSKICRIEFLDY